MSSLALLTKSRSLLRERRNDVRYRCHRIVYAQPNGTALGVRWGVALLNLSTRGALLELRQPLTVGVLLAIQPTNDCPTAPVVGRVVRIAPQGADRWLCGCVLVEPLSDDEVQDWLN